MHKSIFVAFLLGAPAVAYAQTSDEQWMDECRSRRDTARRAYACDVAVTRIPARDLLTVRSGENGAVAILAHNGKDIEIHTRVQAYGRTQDEAQALARQTSPRLGDTIRVTGPRAEDGMNWSASFVIYVPRATNLDVSGRNGPIEVSSISGRMRLNVLNGPLDLVNLSGDVRARSANGPVTITLAGTRWEGGGLDVETENGPMTLEIPRTYNAALEAGTINGPFESEIPLTVTIGGEQGRQEHFKAILGSGGPKIRVVTTNGPLSIHSIN